MSITLTLYMRHGCHLCEAFYEELKHFQSHWSFTVDEVDVDSSPALVEKYGTLVPVLTIGEQQICHYFMDPDKLKTYFEYS